MNIVFRTKFDNMHSFGSNNLPIKNMNFITYDLRNHSRMKYIKMIGMRI